MQTEDVIIVYLLNMNVQSENLSLHVYLQASRSANSSLTVSVCPLCVKQEFVQFFRETLDRKVCWADRMEFINGWYILLIISDILTITGSVIKIGIESKVCCADPLHPQVTVSAASCG